MFLACACDVVLGLNKYSETYCNGSDCPDASSDGAQGASSDAGTDATSDSATDAFADAEADGDGGPELADVAIDSPSLALLWAQWPMPNPDAAIAPDSSTLLPNPMLYAANVAATGGDAGDGGSDASDAAVPTSVTDLVTGLVWETATDTASSQSVAEETCAGRHGRLPTRIELVSLIDFTQIPTVDNAVFPGTQMGDYWTSSVYAVGSTPAQSWLVDFGDGTVHHAQSPPAAYVRCVLGGSP